MYIDPTTEEVLKKMKGEKILDIKYSSDISITITTAKGEYDIFTAQGSIFAEELEEVD